MGQLHAQVNHGPFVCGTVPSTNAMAEQGQRRLILSFSPIGQDSVDSVPDSPGNGSRARMRAS
jgi:hypothetical protein